MTSVLLTAPTPLDVHVGVDCHRTSGTQRHVPLPLGFGFSAPSAPFITRAGTTSYDPDVYTDDDGDGSPTLSSDADTRALVPRQWTGAPIRAIVPLPRRASASPHGVTLSNGPVNARHTAVGTPTQSVKDNDGGDASMDADVDSDSDLEITIEIVAPQEDDGDEDEDDAGQGTRLRYCSYESITAAEGLSAWSFEELRVECYAQSHVARGVRPPPVVQPSLAIPPAFTPRIISRN